MYIKYNNSYGNQNNHQIYWVNRNMPANIFLDSQDILIDA